MENSLNQSVDKQNGNSSKSFALLKILVVVMGILIIAGVVIIAITITNRILSKSDDANAIPWLTKPEVPAGAQIHSITANEKKLFVNMKFHNGDNIIIIFQIETGKEIGRFKFETQP